MSITKFLFESKWRINKIQRRRTVPAYRWQWRKGDRRSWGREGMEIPLAMLPLGIEGRISSIRGGRGLVRRLIEMGFQLGEKVRVIHSHNPGPVVAEVKDTRIALGRGVAMRIMVVEVT